jgi:hypothetical protein
VTAIAVTCEMGTLGKDAAAGLSERSPGITVFTTKLVEHDVAERAGVARYRGGRWPRRPDRVPRLPPFDMTTVRTQANDQPARPAPTSALPWRVALPCRRTPWL